ncbi:sulfite exporter TauE/SafE family protein [Nocardioides sp.]|uniref:sulfite exporter TauE/SafE family protein n=1 Tax=Nocardioides sp. TaxID=35761 RepID=UPI0035284AEA
MSVVEAAAILLAGVGAGTINTVVGSGTLITFPTLLAFGIPPVTANVSNNVGLVPGALSGTLAGRRELAGQRRLVRALAPASLVGGALGAVLLLVLPASAFAAIVPALIVLGVVLVVVQPRLSAWVARRHEAVGGLPPTGAWWVAPSVLLAGVYGGYFGAAQGVLLMAVLGNGVADSLNRLNATKNLLSTVVNGVAAAVFILLEPIDWTVAGLIAAGSVVGGQVGARIGRRLPQPVLRGVIVVVGTVAVLALLTT